ncbi:hypothetical protein QFZ75_004219 [Streptomyces sp. V3I8]|uniref:hypothetical protein n=1 Tax=Streptomyces sp. V3I8 TaxID=3042279 RepID=UPI002786304F|nr:hypothetical protein [Streptomyces sp. V3I8]MDQ1037803.1 hypothetical protein [Streptomyces sp. V3I8]
MAESQSNAPLRADAGTPTSGVIHVRTRLTADFTVISNALAQRRGSAVTVGVATYILSLPDGSPVSIAALCEHFDEGEILISRALRELERAGYLERRRERGPGGHIRTRTFFHSVPGGRPEPDGPPDPPKPPKPSKSAKPAEPPRPRMPLAVEAVPAAQEATHVRHEAEEQSPLAAADPRAVAVLASLRHVDSRLLLSGQDVARLAPAVTQWLAAGVLPTHITEHLTARLPDHLLARPASILAFRLRETPLPPPARARIVEPEIRTAIVPFQTCDGCERAFRAAVPGHCRDCRSGRRLRAAG